MSAALDFIENLSAYLPSHGVISNATGSVVLLRSFFPAAEGKVDQGQYLKLGLCMSAGGEVRNRCYDGVSTLTVWRQGEVYLTGPANRGEFTSPDVDMVGLAIDLERFSLVDIDLKALSSVSNQVISDDVISSILVALWNSADAYGGTEPFIDHGVRLILKRLLELFRSGKVKQGHFKQLSSRQISKVREYIDSHIAKDIRAPDLCKLLGMEPKRFASALRATSGYAPYTYIASRRMEVAKRHLNNGSSVTEVALLVGYSNPGKFSAAFRRLVGCSPSRWRAGD